MYHHKVLRDLWGDDLVAPNKRAMVICSSGSFALAAPLLATINEDIGPSSNVAYDGWRGEFLGHLSTKLVFITG